MSSDQYRARIAALEAEFQALEAQYRENYAYDFSEWEADDDQFDEAIRGAMALQAQFEALPGKVSALREELVGLVQQAEAARDMAQNAVDAAEAAVSEAEDLASEADLLDDGEFERDDMNETVAVLEARRRELMAGEGEKGVPRHMLKRKDASGTRRIERKGNLHQQLAALEELLRAGEEARQTGARVMATSDEADAETREGMSDEDMQAFQAQMEEIARLQQRLMGKSAKSAKKAQKGMLGDLWSWFTRASPSADEAFLRRRLEGEYADVEDHVALANLIDLFVDVHARWQEAINNDDESGQGSAEHEMGLLRGQLDDLQRGKSAKSASAHLLYA